MQKSTLKHPVHKHFHGNDTPLGIRLANAVTGFMGSWTFLIIQTVIVAAWIAGNVYLMFHFDAYPFILLNLAFSTQAAYAAPLILMASNVAAARDRELWDHDYDTNQKAYSKIEDLEMQIKLISQQNNDMLKIISGQKLEKEAPQA
ncbi:MAG: DUF1003 domain-containing protein [Abditibacteriaceae bacterium]